MLRKVLFMWSSMPIFSFIGYTLTKLFRKPDNWRGIYKKTSSTLYTSNEAWCKSGTRTPGPRTPSKFKSGARDPPPLKFKSGAPGPPSKFKSRTPGPSSKFKSWTLIIFLHCLNYFVLDKNIYNMEIIFHE